MFEVLIVLVYAFAMMALARMSGGGLGAVFLKKRGSLNDDGTVSRGIMPFNLSMLPEICFGFGIALAVVGTSWWAIPIAAWSYGFMETGHGQAFHMGFKPIQDPKRKPHKLTPIVNWVADKMKQPRYGTFYCWFFMGLKGFLIGLPLTVFAPIFAFFWPAAYALGTTARADSWDDDTKNTGTVIGEYVTGFMTGVFCATYMLIFR